MNAIRFPQMLIVLAWLPLLVLAGQFLPAASTYADGNSAEDMLQTIPESLYRKAFDQFVLRETGRASEDIVVSKFKVLRDVPVSFGTVNIRVIQKDNRELAEYVRLKAVVTVNGVLENKVELCAWLDVFETVVCASKTLKRGSVIQPQDLYLDRRNVSSMIDDVVADVNQVAGLMAKHNVKVNEPVKQWILKKAPVVQRGDMVTILVQSGGMKITAPGKVMADGAAGQTIMVLNTMSSRKVYARVVDNQTVQVDL